MIKIGKQTFSGTSKIFDGTLADVVRRMAQLHAASFTASVTDLTDNSGGASGGDALADITALTPFTEVGTASAAKAGWDTAWALVRDGIADIALQVNDVHAVAPAGALTDNSGGAGNDTIVAIGDTGAAVNGAGDNALSVVQANLDITALKLEIVELTRAVNRMAVATGQTEIALAATYPVADLDETIAAIPANSGAGVDGTALSTATKVDADARLDEMADILATLAAKMNATTGPAPTAVTVVAN